MRLELQHAINPVDVWLVKVIENVGGRLYLRLEGAESGSHDFWLFYLNHRIHPIGWAKANGYKYSPPPGMFLVCCPSCLYLKKYVICKKNRSSKVFKLAKLDYLKNCWNYVCAYSPLYDNGKCLKWIRIIYFLFTCTMCLGFAELIMQFQEEVDWMKVLETALRESEKMVLPLAIFKVQIALIQKVLFVL